MNKTTISSIYLLKSIACFFVVACHVPLLGSYKDYILGPFLYICVPIFFMISGFFTNLSKENIGNNAKKTVKLLKLIFFVNLVYIMSVYFNHGFMIRSIDDVVKMFLFGNIVSGHLWYLSAYFVSFVILYISVYFIGDRHVIFLPFLALAGLALSSYNILFSNILDSTNVLNAIFTGLPYMAIGYCFRKYNMKILFGTYGIYLILFFLFLNYLEIYIIRDNENLFPASGYYICTLPLAVSVFAFFLNHTNWGNGSIFENIGVNDSGNVYYFHVIVWTAFQRAVAIISPDTQPNNCLSMTYMGGVIVFILTVIISKILNAIQNKTRINMFK